MKKISILLCFHCLLFSVAVAQTPYYDALKARNELITVNGANFRFKVDPNAVKELLTMLKRYLPDSIKHDPALTDAMVFNAYKTNPFFGAEIAPLALGGAGFAAAGLFGSILSSAGNLDVTNIADGFAKFLVKRTKEELNVAFFSRFYREIKKPEYRDLQILFPQTYLMLSAIGDEIYNYAVYLNNLRQSFEKDLASLLPNLPKVVERGVYSKYFNDHPELKATVLSALYVGNGLDQKKHPGQIIGEYDVNLLNAVNIDIKAGVQTGKLFSESLRSNGTGHYWITSDSLKLLLEDPITLKLYFGLLYQQAHVQQITFNKGPLTSIITPVLKTDITAYHVYIKGFIAQATTLTVSIRNLADKAPDKRDFADYYGFYNEALNTIEYAMLVTNLRGINITIPQTFKDHVANVRTAGNIALDLNQRNYGSAVINTYMLYTNTFGKDDIVQGAEKSKPGKVEELLFKYGSFMAAVAEAENSDEVAKAIEAAVLPVGSSKVKRATSFNVSVNAYTGLFAGHEWIKDLDSKNKTVFNTFGVTAPIGIAFSGGHRLLFCKTKAEWSTSLFLSLVDIGAVAAFRFGDDTTAQVPTIQLKNIIAPGAFLSIGIPNTPLSANFGIQMGPNLRKIDMNKEEVPSEDNNNKIYWRLSAGICVDIPLLNLHTRTR
jgi:hypothetical protein